MSMGRSAVVALVGLAMMLAPAAAMAQPQGALDRDARPQVQQDAGQQQEAQQEQQQAQAEPTPVELEGGAYIDRVLVRVNGEPILMSDVEEQWATYRENLRIPQEVLDQQEDRFRVQVLGALVNQLLLQQRAEEMGITATTNQVDRAVANVMQNIGAASQEDLERQLAAQGMTMGEFRQMMADQIVQQTLLTETVQRDLFVAEREVAAYYEANRDDFRDPEQVMIQQVIFTLREGQAMDALRQTAEAALAELRSGVSLATVGQKYEGADVRGAEGASWIAVDDMLPEIATAVEGLTIGDYSDPIQTRFGFQILQVINRQEEKVLTLEEAAPEVRQILMIEKQEEAIGRYTQDLLETAYVEVLAPGYESVLEELRNAGTADTSGQGR